MTNRIPSIPASRDRNPTLDKVRELLNIWKGEAGNKLDKVVTVGDLLGINLAGVNKYGLLTPITATDDDAADSPLYTGPLSDLQANGGFRLVFLNWSGVSQVNYAYTEIHRATEDNLANAVLQGTAIAGLYADQTVNSGQDYYYWVRAVSTTGHKSDFNATAGTLGTAVLEPDYVISLIEGLLDESSLLPAFQDRIDLIDAPTTGLIYRAGTLENQITNILNVVQDDGTTLNQRFQQIGSSTGTVYTQDTEPTGGTYLEGDLWIDTNDANKLYSYISGMWVSVDDDDILALQQAVGNAQTTADGKIVSFWQAEEPASASNGDIWFDTDDQNHPYRYSAGIWVDARDDSIADAFQAASDAQVTADGKIVSFYSDTEPTAQAIGDLWVDTSDGNHVKRWNGTVWTSARDATIQTAIDDAAEALAVADGSIITFYQTTPPPGASLGDLWFDTDDENAPYRWDGDAWVDASNNALASALFSLQQVQYTLDGKVATYFQDEPPTAEALGDLWVDTDKSNIMHRWDGAAWQEIRDLGVAVGLGKTKAFYSDNEPTAEQLGDLWFDTNDDNKPYRWDGEDWIELGLATVAGVSADIIDNNQTMIGYCVVAGNPASQHVTPAACAAAGGQWQAAEPLAESVKQVAVSDGEQTAAIEQLFQAARTDLEKFITSYILRLDNNGHISGIALGNDGNTSEMIVASDAVYFIDPSISPTPFDPSTDYASLASVRNTQLIFGYARVEGQQRFVINVPAYIANGTITTAQIKTATINEINALVINSLEGWFNELNSDISFSRIANALRANIKLGVVDTLKISGNAVSMALAGELAVSQLYTQPQFGQWRDLITLDIPAGIVALNEAFAILVSVHGAAIIDDGPITYTQYIVEARMSDASAPPVELVAPYVVEMWPGNARYRFWRPTAEGFDMWNPPHNVGSYPTYTNSQLMFQVTGVAPAPSYHYTIPLGIDDTSLATLPAGYDQIVLKLNHTKISAGPDIDIEVNVGTKLIVEGRLR